MSLAGVIAEYRSEMICDLAETYQIYDYKRVPGRFLGTLVAGLGANSRVKKRMFGVENDVPDVLLLARIMDNLEILKWWKTKDGSKGRNPPEMITRFILGQDEKTIQNKETMLFRTGAEFDRYREHIMEMNEYGEH